MEHNTWTAPSPPESRDTVIHVRLTPTTRDSLDKYARLHNTSRSTTASSLLQAALASFFLKQDGASPDVMDLLTERPSNRRRRNPALSRSDNRPWSAMRGNT